MPATKSARSSRFLKALADHDDILIVTHDNPDPDAIASGWAFAVLIRERLEKPVRVIASGAIVRAENARMVKLLNPPIELVDRFASGPKTAIVLADCTPTAANQLLEGTGLQPVAVIDHHEPTGPAYRVRFRDVRKNVAATATIAACYLQDQQIEPSTELATALVYAIETDAIGWPRFSRADRRMIAWATQRADPAKLADIRSAPLPRAYFADLLLAMESTRVFGKTAIAFLPHAHGAEVVGEVADLLIRCQDLNRVLCAAAVNGDTLVSVRTTAGGGDAAVLVRKTLAGLGRGGGHSRRAGGKIVGGARSPEPAPAEGAAPPPEQAEQPPDQPPAPPTDQPAQPPENAPAEQPTDRAAEQPSAPADRQSDTKRARPSVDESTHSAPLSEPMQAELRQRWLHACGISNEHGERLVAQSEIIENL